MQMQMSCEASTSRYRDEAQFLCAGSNLSALHALVEVISGLTNADANVL